ncbi:tetratricopeptide repeat protein [Armatimonas rosea]|uniref:Tetratricopeptide (TPR) repeat protein n=1 Tax=Armatimonas rosea TaxID=685828 RepID=A0A7W9SS57_ARMRO|nr:tetratricopeptide repeat protein [Armatimonas rosea]MBB6051400.1 tetratricopeptide (TPR) repeat protein [Armatimonas rosea]
MDERDDDLAPVAEENAAPTSGEAGHEEPDDDVRDSDPYSTLSGDEDEAQPTAQLLSEQGEKRLDEGNIGEALDKYRGAVRAARKTGEDESDHRVNLGDAYAYSGQGLNAFRQYKRAIKLSPRKAEPHFSMGELYHRYGRLPSAVHEYRTALQFAPDNAWYRYRLSEALLQMGDLPAAIAELEETVKLKPQDGFYHFWLGDLYGRAERFDEAIRELQQATLFAPYDAYYNVRLGAFYRRRKMYRDAALAVRQALRLAPKNAPYHCLLADLYSDLRLDDYAVHHYQAAGMLDDYDTEQLHRLRVYAGIESEDLLALEAFELDANGDFAMPSDRE